MIGFDRTTNKLKFDFDGDALTKDKTDGSSYPNGSLRNTDTNGRCLTMDTSSTIFLLNGVIHIHSVFVSYHGKALDEKNLLPDAPGHHVHSLQHVRARNGPNAQLPAIVPARPRATRSGAARPA